jgi:hypothetical protein
VRWLFASISHRPEDVVVVVEIGGNEPNSVMVAGLDQPDADITSSA